jgi:hypothetical protein
MQNDNVFPEHRHESGTTEYVGHFNAGDQLRLVSQGLSNYGGQIASILSSLVLVPLMMVRLGAEAYGFWIVALPTPAFWQESIVRFLLRSLAKALRTAMGTELPMSRPRYFCQPVAVYKSHWESYAGS